MIVAVTRMSSREFNQDTGSAKRAARQGPVYVTDRGRVSHVLLSFEEYERLERKGASNADLLAGPPGVEDVDFVVPALGDLATPADFD
jgi:prevent-host-death family protein